MEKFLKNPKEYDLKEHINETRGRPSERNPENNFGRKLRKISK